MFVIPKEIPVQRARVSKKIFDIERIGLMYISDYLYGALPEYWIISNGNYNNANVRNNNWMYVGLYEQSITRDFSNSSDVRRLDCAGYVHGSGPILSYSFSVRPTFYITANAKLKEGNGTKEIPYRIMFE